MARLLGRGMGRQDEGSCADKKRCEKNFLRFLLGFSFRFVFAFIAAGFRESPPPPRKGFSSPSRGKRQIMSGTFSINYFTGEICASLSPPTAYRALHLSAGEDNK
jgi:hypothetical protein